MRAARRWARPEGRVGAGVGQRVADGGEFGAQLGESLRWRVLDAESHAHRGGDADSWRAADDHVFDRFRYVAIVGVGVIGDFAREAELVEDDDAFGRPADCFDGVHGSFHSNRFWRANSMRARSIQTLPV